MRTVTKERMTIIVFFIMIALLLSFYISYIAKSFQPYVMVQIDGELLGYYVSKDEYINTYNKSCVNDNSMYDINYYLKGEPSFTSVLVKPSFVKNLNNIDLIKQHLIKKYNIYELTINQREKLYFNTKQQAEDLKKEIQKKITKIQIEIIPVTSSSLECLSTMQQITDITNKYNRVSKVTSRSGSRINYRTAIKIVEGNYKWPLPQKKISSSFGMRTLHNHTKMHTGVDIPCPLDTDVVAVDKGVVICAEWCGGYGNYLQIDHGAGIISAYAHLNSFDVKVGDTIIKGQTIGKSGSTGNSTGPHLHLEYKVNGSFCNPLTFYKGS